jgi:ketosteroid isomerase-like protein
MVVGSKKGPAERGDPARSPGSDADAITPQRQPGEERRQPVEPDQTRKLVEAFYQAFNAGDRETYCGLLHPDFEAEITGSGEVSGHMDREAFSKVVFESVGKIFPGGLQVSVLQLIAEGDALACRVEVSGRTRSGEPYCNPACHVFRLRDGRIVEMIEYFDTVLSQSAFAQASDVGRGR